MPTDIACLPDELIGHILSLTRPNLAELVSLASVNRTFRRAALGGEVCVQARLPLADDAWRFLVQHDVPLESLASAEPPIFIYDQARRLNLRKLKFAEITSYGDYAAKGTHLAPATLALQALVADQASHSLRHLMVSLDLEKTGGHDRTLSFLAKFKRLSFLSVSFTTALELREAVRRGANDGGAVLTKAVAALPELKVLYIFHCPAVALRLSSATLERLHIYRSQISSIAALDAQSLINLVAHSQPADYPANKQAIVDALGAAYVGCPQLLSFNGADLSGLDRATLSPEEWVRLALAAYERRVLGMAAATR